MSTQNSTNTGIIATASEIILQSDPRKTVAPGPLGTALNMMRNEAPGRYENLSMSLSAGVLSFVGFNGSALSTTNPAYVNLPSKVFPGRGIRHQLTSGDFSFNESELTSNLFGTTNVVAWGSLMPFYVYLVANDADALPVFAICRVPHLQYSPSVANSGKPGTTTANTEQSFWYLDSSISLSDYDGNPCVSLGCFSMSKSGANVWTIAGLFPNDGFGNFNEIIDWDFPTAQFGAVTGGYLKNNGGTAPTFTTNSVTYNIARNGVVSMRVLLIGNGGTTGAGGVNAQMVIPLDPQYNRDIAPVVLEADTTGFITSMVSAPGSNLVTFRSLPGVLTVTNAFWGTPTNRLISSCFQYFVQPV